MGKKKRLNKKTENDELLFESDEFHYFIAGYTSGGASYGITWEEAEAEGLLDDLNVRPEICEDKDEYIPF